MPLSCKILIDFTHRELLGEIAELSSWASKVNSCKTRVIMASRP